MVGGDRRGQVDRVDRVVRDHRRVIPGGPGDAELGGEGRRLLRVPAVHDRDLDALARHEVRHRTPGDRPRADDGPALRTAHAEAAADRVSRRASRRSRCRSGSAVGEASRRRGCSRSAGCPSPRRRSPVSTISPLYMHRDAVADVPHDGEVVGDEQVGDAGAALHLDQQIEDARLCRQVERRDGLVADDQLAASAPALVRWRPADAARR